MTEIKCKTIGGITYNIYDIKNSHNIDGTYTVTLKDGTKLIYPEQELSREAEVVFDRSGRIDFKGFYGVEIKDTPKNDSYRLMGCENVTLEAARGGDIVDCDLVQVIHRRTSDGRIQNAKNNTLKLDRNDLYSLPNDIFISSVDDDEKSIS